MKMQPCKARAFTLIELLIVVAIIAILAAIAVPNFLEAQVRAKIGRVKSDMRTVATALESYKIDTNKYPHLHGFYLVDIGKLSDGGTGKPGQCDRGGIDAVYSLSTPIAYLSSVNMPDPFMQGGKTNMTAFGAIPNLAKHTSYSFNYLNVDQIHTPGKPRRNPKHWYCLSLGPDFQKAGGSLGNYQTGSSIPDSSGTWEWPAFSYDASNGTISGGDILRWN